MRNKALVFITVCVFVTLLTLTVLPQAQEKKAPLYIVEDTMVKPSKIAEYEIHVKLAVELFKKYEYPYPVYNFSTDDMHYISVFPMKNFADMDTTIKATGELAQKAGEEFQAMIKSAEGTLNYSKYFMVRYIPQLSYIPENPRLKPVESAFILCEFFYVIPGEEGAFAEACRKIIAMYKEKNITDGWEMYVGSIGTETPLFIVLFRAKSAADYFSQEEKIMELLGEEFQALIQEGLTPTIRKIERISGRFRPDLSYIPEKGKTEE